MVLVPTLLVVLLLRSFVHVFIIFLVLMFICAYLCCRVLWRVCGWYCVVAVVVVLLCVVLFVIVVLFVLYMLTYMRAFVMFVAIVDIGYTSICFDEFASDDGDVVVGVMCCVVHDVRGITVVVICSYVYAYVVVVDVPGCRCV